MREIELNGTWHLENDAGQQYTAHVPDCVHTDLYSEDEMFRDWNSEHCRWIEQHDWSYTREFTLTPEDISEEAGIPELLFEGLDTYCEIRLNDVLVGTAENMFIPHRFCVKGRLRAGVNTLCVRFHSPVHAVADRPPRSGAFTTERLYTRRMQCSYGWDWGDRFVTCGIYRPVRLLWHKASELEHVSIVTEHLDAWGAQLKITAQLRHNHTSGAQIFMQILSPDGAVVYKNRCFSAEELAVWYVDLAKPALWYPRPYGAQPLYTLRMEVGGQCAEQRFGVRTLRILQTQDTKPADIQRCHALQATPSGHEYDENTTFSCFTPVVNGVKVFCTGANWVPCEPFPSAETPEKITRLLEMAAASNINMIRVWGGGLFEQQHFYDECDRLGLLVCQDFLMACGDYPEDDADFLRQLAQEAETAAYALRNHPCLAWWHGDNENAVNGDDTQEVYPGRLAARRALGPVLERVDPSHRFLPSSPYGGKKYASKTVGTTHNTQFLGTTFSYLEQPELSDYREKWEEYRARFISEEPIFGAVSRSSLSRFLSPQYQSDHDAWLHHTKGNPALSRPLLDMFTKFAQKLFGAFADWDDQHFKMRYLQYELVRLTVCNARRDLWFCSGILYWMLNDCWPAAMGWSLCDYYAQEKAGLFALRQYAQPVSVSIEPENGGLRICIGNILPDAAVCSLCVWRVDLRSGTAERVLQQADISCAQSTELFVEDAHSEHALFAAELQVDAEKPYSVRNWYRTGCPYLQRADSALRWSIERAPGKTCGTVVLYAEQYLHVVELKGFSGLLDNYFSMLPGEEKRVAFLDTAEMQSIEAYTLIPGRDEL